jgi:N-acetylglucosamine malate deacetylase 1
MGGTLCLLKEAGYQTHYLNIASGSCGSVVYGRTELRAIRRREARNAARVLGAKFHPGQVDDFSIFYDMPLLRWLTAIIREIRPSIVLTHPPHDYMEDHEQTCRLVVSATFARGMPNFPVKKAFPIWDGDAIIYHSIPHGICDSLRHPFCPDLFIDTSSVHERALRALACHRSQASWLKESQGMKSMLTEMDATAREVGRMSGRFALAEGWRRHSHMGFGPIDADPLRDALGVRAYLKAKVRPTRQADVTPLGRKLTVSGHNGRRTTTATRARRSQATIS